MIHSHMNQASNHFSQPFCNAAAGHLDALAIRLHIYQNGSAGIQRYVPPAIQLFTQLRKPGYPLWSIQIFWRQELFSAQMYAQAAVMLIPIQLAQGNWVQAAADR